MTDTPVSKVQVIKPGQTYAGKQGFQYGAGASKETVGAEQICMNILPMPAGARAKVHYHDKIETIAYLLEGNCTVFYGDKMQHHIDVQTGDQIFVPADVPHAPCNRSGAPCKWLVVHASGSDQEGIVLLPELDVLLATQTS
ncbi:MAG: cupin domain-containing protein [Hyphomicrobiaceae bacterium]|nr:cupin domain-containing protein [Hyphomicrobiaceae bacterium]